MENFRFEIKPRLLFFIVMFALISGCTSTKVSNELKKDDSLLTFVVYNSTTSFKNASIFDTIYIYEPTKSEMPIATINTTIKPEMRESYQLVGDKLYFYHLIDHIIECIDFKGNIHKLNYTKVNTGYELEFLVSPNLKKIAWISTEGEQNDIKSTVFVSDLDGKNRRILIQRSFSGKILKLVKWGNSGKEIYIGEALEGLGGLVVYRNYETIYKININSGQIQNIIGTISPLRQLTDDTDFISDLSPNEELISYFNKVNGHFKLFIRNIKSQKEYIFDVPDGEGYLGAGNAFFSSDSKFLRYEIAIINPQQPVCTGEYLTKYILVDLTKKTLRIYNEDEFPYFIVNKCWLNKNDPIVSKVMKKIVQK